ncbi:hypothetical protein FGO68_gene4576 [Halteria grandinella]|uniref:Uncharacterized protein n=1 Tax=Halteria grandinella TaxID=5974 RepID=A0A8J8NUG3_HALGN|nr:hypothetical protein FGO68_gene4576 [Halteria grandinella]
MHARLDMHEQKLNDLLILRTAVGEEEGGSAAIGKKTVKDQLRDMLMNRCKKNVTQTTTHGAIQVKVNEYANKASQKNTIKYY